MKIFTTSRRLWWGIALLLVLLWVASSLLPPLEIGIPQAPWATWVSLPVVRFARDVVAAITFGCVLVGGLVFPERSVRVLRWGSTCAVIWLILLFVQFIVTISDVLAVSIPAALDPTTMWSVLTQVTLGRVFMWQAIGVLLVGILSQAVVSRVTAWVVFAFACGACLAPAFLGHGGLSGGHAAATISLAIHLIAISAWLGGLVAVVSLLAVEPGGAAAILHRFSPVALAAAIIAAETGLLNSSIRLAQPALFLTTWYGALVIGKVILIGWLAFYGMRQRRRVIPLLEPDGVIGVGALTLYALQEFLIMGFAVGVAVAMSRIGPLSAPNSNGAVNLLAVALLLLGIPQLVPLLGHRPRSSFMRKLGAYPEVVSVVAAVVTIELFGLNLFSHLFGVQLGSLVSIIVIMFIGWLLACALSGERGRQGVLVAIPAWLITVGVVTYFQLIAPQAVVDMRSVGASALLGVLLCGLYAWPPLNSEATFRSAESIESRTPSPQ